MDIISDFTPRGSWWSLTLNNPTDDDFGKVKGPPPRWLKMIKGQEETGESGTHHLQMVINTDFIRASQIKEWLPRAHMKLCKTAQHKDNCLKYVEKSETSIEGTRFQFQHRQESEQMTMAGSMLKLAEYAFSDEYIRNCMKRRNYNEEGKDIGAVYKNREEVLTEEYWTIVNMILMDNENLVALYTQPQYLRAWLKTRAVWISKFNIDRQTDVRISEE